MQYRTIASPMLCVCCSDGGVDKELWNVCDAACQHMMTKQSSTFRSTQPCPAPLSLSLAPHSFPPFLFSFLSLLYLMLLSPPPFFSFSTFSTSSSSCQAFVLLFCFDTFLKHVEEREEAKTEGERMERRRKKEGGLVSEKVRDWSACQFLSLCCGEKDRESESARESKEIKSQQRWRG